MARFNTNETLLLAAKRGLDALTEDNGTVEPLTRDEAAETLLAAWMAFIQDAVDDMGTFAEALIDVALIGAEMAATLKGEDAEASFAPI